MIRLDRARYTFPGRSTPALNDLSLTINEGEFLVILGRNGSGKSTFCLHLNGLLQPAGGSVSVDGLSTLNPDDVWKIRQLVAMVFQNPDNQIVATVVEEDVAFGPENLGLPRSEIRTRVDDALAAVGLSELSRYDPHLLSAGQKQRVALAGALAMQPKYLVLDEPTAMLDPAGRERILETLHRLNRDTGTTIIYATHFVEEAVRASRTIVMADGAVELDGRPAEVLADPDRLGLLGVGVPVVRALGLRLAARGVGPAGVALTSDELVEALL